MSQYARGARVEYKARDYLRDQGFFVVRAAGSRGPIDLVAIGKTRGDVLMIQVKNNRPPNEEELSQLGILGAAYATPVQSWTWLEKLKTWKRLKPVYRLGSLVPVQWVEA